MSRSLSRGFCGGQGVVRDHGRCVHDCTTRPFTAVRAVEARDEGWLAANNLVKRRDPAPSAAASAARLAVRSRAHVLTEVP